MFDLITIGVIIGIIVGLIAIITAAYKFSQFLKQKIRMRIGQPTPIIHKRLRDYWGGICPNCGQHIGINIIQHRLTKKKFGICGACGKQFDPDKAECLEKRDSAGKVVFKKD